MNEQVLQALKAQLAACTDAAAIDGIMGRLPEDFREALKVDAEEKKASFDAAKLPISDLSDAEIVALRPSLADLFKTEPAPAADDSATETLRTELEAAKARIQELEAAQADASKEETPSPELDSAVTTVRQAAERLGIADAQSKDFSELVLELTEAAANGANSVEKDVRQTQRDFIAAFSN